MSPSPPPVRPTRSSLLSTIRKIILPVAGDNARYEAESIVCHCASLARQDLYLQGTVNVEAPQEYRALTMARSRAAGTPLGYVLGVVHFHSVDIQVDPRVLIPRPDSEQLVELILATENADGALRFLDVGSGSGALTAALLHNRPQWRGYCCDISQGALDCSRNNLPPQAVLVRGDLLAPFATRFDFMVSNPPYIARERITGLEHSVRDHEPHVALDGGTDGLRFYRLLAAQAADCLVTGGRFYAEIGFDQGAQAQHIFTSAGWQECRIGTDLAGRCRTLRALPPLS